MDCLVDTNVILRSADRSHPSSTMSIRALKVLFRRGYRMCMARQSLIEAWVVATRPRDVNGFGLSAAAAATGLSRVKRVFHLLPDSDEIYLEWERLVAAHAVLGKPAHDARLVAAMNVHAIRALLTFIGPDFLRYPGLQVIHPLDLESGDPARS